MTNRLIAAAGLALALTFGAAPSLACRITKDFDVKDLEPVDVIVLGRIQNYKVVREGTLTHASTSWSIRSSKALPDKNSRSSGGLAASNRRRR